MPSQLAYRTLADARAAAAAAGGVLRAPSGAAVPPAPAPAELLAERLGSTLERIVDAVRLQTELLARLAPPAPAAPAPEVAPAPVAPAAVAPPVEPRLDAAPAPVAAPAPSALAVPFDVVLTRDPRTRRVAELQLRRPGEQAAAIAVAVVRSGPQQLVSELRLATPGAAARSVVRVERDRMSRRLTMLRVLPPS